ncbi:MAG: hypothetical protein R3F24_01630 [Gammaproteobacteria bacterium]
MHHLIGPVWGNFIIIVVTGAITVGCFVVMIRLLIRPEETDQRHPKYDILRDDR